MGVAAENGVEPDQAQKVADIVVGEVMAAAIASWRDRFGGHAGTMQ